MEELPEYMKLCYFAMLNFGNELAYDVLKEEGLDVLSNIKDEVDVQFNLITAKFLC